MGVAQDTAEAASGRPLSTDFLRPLHRAQQARDAVEIRGGSTIDPRSIHNRTGR